MPWVKLDEHMPEHPKLAKTGPLGLALQVAALCYCNRHLTNGVIPWAIAHSLLNWEFPVPSKNGGGPLLMTIAVTSGMSGDDVDSEYVIDLLLRAGVWLNHPDGYEIHDYLSYQPSRAEVLEKRAKKQAAGQAGGKATAAAHAQAERQQTDSK